MIKNNNTYKQDNKIKDLVFSEGEDLTNEDLDIIESRSTTFYVQDEEYERFWDEEYNEYTNTLNFLNKYESQYNAEDTFTIGNNLSGGI